MKNRTPDPRAPGRPTHRQSAVVTTRRKLMNARARRGIERITIPSMAEAERRMRSTQTFLSSFTPEELAAICEMEPTGPLLGRLPKSDVRASPA